MLFIQIAEIIAKLDSYSIELVCLMGISVLYADVPPMSVLPCNNALLCCAVLCYAGFDVENEMESPPRCLS